MVKPVKTYQNDWEFDQLLDTFKRLKPERILEIGSAYGGSLYHWIHNAPKGALIVSLDLGDPQMVDYPLWLEWAKDAGVNLQLVTGNSNEMGSLHAVMRISPVYDWIFIDGAHDSTSVRRDWDWYGKLAAPSGIVAFDDIKTHPETGVHIVWADIKRTHSTSEIIQEGDGLGNGLGIVWMG